MGYVLEDIYKPIQKNSFGGLQKILIIFISVKTIPMLVWGMIPAEKGILGYYVKVVIEFIIIPMIARVNSV